MCTSGCVHSNNKTHLNSINQGELNSIIIHIITICIQNSCSNITYFMLSMYCSWQLIKVAFSMAVSHYLCKRPGTLRTQSKWLISKSWFHVFFSVCYSTFFLHYLLTHFSFFHAKSSSSGNTFSVKLEFELKYQNRQKISLVSVVSNMKIYVGYPRHKRITVILKNENKRDVNNFSSRSSFR